MKKALYFLTFLFLAVTVTSCKKNKDDNTAPATATIPGVYKVTSINVKSAGLTVDLYNRLTECEKNDTWGFQQNGTFLFGGAAAANCGDPDFDGTWKLANNVLTITTTQGNDDYKFVSFNGRVLSLSYDGNYNGADATFSFNLTKQ